MNKNDVASERKHQIVRATVDCITKYGYHNFSMQDVARTAGVSKGIIHYYFLNKDDLMMSVLETVASDIEKILQADMDSSNSPLRKIEVFIEVCSEVVRNTREYYQVNMDFWTQINQKEDVRKIIASHYNKFRETCSKVIEEGITSGEFRKVDVKETASILIGMLDGISLQWLFDPTSFDFDRAIKNMSELFTKSLINK